MNRDPLNRYYTPDLLAETCVRAIRAQYPDLVTMHEPGAGGGAFGRAWMKQVPGSTVFGCDIDPNAKPGFPCDVCDVVNWNPSRADIILTNPPYRKVIELVAEYRDLQSRAGGLLALLLRATAFEQIVDGTDPPEFAWVSRQRARWGGPGGMLHKTGDSCGAILMLWSEGKSHSTRAMGMGQWRPPGRRKTLQTCQIEE